MKSQPFPHTFDSTGTRAPSALFETPHWFACYTRARHEKTVAGLLQRQGVESYLPVLAVSSQWKDRVKRVDFPLFPGYVFASFTLHQLVEVLSTHGVCTVVSAAGYPTPIPAAEIESVRLASQVAAHTGAEVERAPLVLEGTRVRVAAGPFRGVEGVVVTRRGNHRVLVGIAAIGQGLEVDIRVTDLVVIPDAA
jgi:transcription antitermination factor NusG